MFSKLLIATLFIAGVANANVQVSQSHKPQGGTSEINLGLGWMMLGETTSTTGGLTTKKGSDASLSYTYGLNDSNAISLGVGFVDHIFEDSFGNMAEKHQGVGPIQLKYSGDMNLNLVTLFYSVGYTHNINKMNFDKDSNKYNGSTAQNSIDLQLGTIVPIENVNFGVAVGYDYNLEGKITVDKLGFSSNEVTAKKGDNISATIFAEIPKDYHFNTSLTYITSYSKNILDSSGNTLVTNPSYSVLSAAINATFDVYSHLQIIPSLAYATDLNKNDQSIVKSDAFQLAATGRFSF